MRHWSGILALACALAASAAAADTRVYSITGVDCVECSNPIMTQVKKIKGVKKTEFDRQKVELTVTTDASIRDEDVLAAIARSGAGFKGTIGAGKGAYIPFGTYPPGADAVVLTHDGAAVGPLEKLRVPGKYTVFDMYADWCGPCRQVDSQLREIVAHRSDVAVRKLNVVDFSSPLAREQGDKLRALPYLVIFSPGGKRTELVGNDTRKIAAALGARP
jgi:thioredoxin 1